MPRARRRDEAAGWIAVTSGSDTLASLRPEPGIRKRTGPGAGTDRARRCVSSSTRVTTKTAVIASKSFPKYQNDPTHHPSPGPGLLGAVLSVGPGSRKPQPTARSPTAQKTINIVWTPGAGRPRRQRLRRAVRVTRLEGTRAMQPAPCGQRRSGQRPPGPAVTAFAARVLCKWWPAGPGAGSRGPLLVGSVLARLALVRVKPAV